MTSQHRKQRGRESERIVADYLKANGFPWAEPVGAGRPGSDITGTVGIDWEVKARRGLDLPALMRQLDDRALVGVLGVGVLRLDRMGPAAIGRWPAVVCLGDLVALLRAAGYGSPVAGAEGTPAAGDAGATP